MVDAKSLLKYVCIYIVMNIVVQYSQYAKTHLNLNGILWCSNAAMLLTYKLLMHVRTYM